MKNVMMAMVFVLFAQLLNAQTESAILKNSWRSEYGYAYTGTGDVSGYSIYTEYARIISNSFKLSPAFGYANFGNVDSYQSVDFLQSGSYRSIELTGYFTPNITNSIEIELGVGGFYKNWQMIYATGSTMGYSIGNSLDLDPSEHGVKIDDTFGYTVSLGFLFWITDNLGINTRGVLQNDLEGYVTTSFRGGFNIAF